MRVLFVAILAVLPRCILAQPADGAGLVTAKVADTLLEMDFTTSGETGLGHDHGALNGDEEEWMGRSDRLMDEQIADLEEKPNTIQNLMKVLFTIDLTEYPVLENLVENFKNSVDGALNKIPPAVELAKATVAEERLARKEKEPASSMTATRALRSSAAAKKPEAETHSHGSEAVPNAYKSDIGSGDSDDDDILGEFDNYETTTMEFDSVNDLQNDTGSAYSSSTSSKSKRKKTAGGRDRGRFHSRDPFGSHTSPHHHRHESFKKIHQGLNDGNHDHLMGILGGAQAHATRAHSEFMDTHTGRRRLGADQELMGHQCMLLTKCAKKMSLYDIMVYFYSDDLDPSTGELDDSIIHFDETNLREKHIRARELARAMFQQNKNNPTDYATESKGQCNALLQLFHRNIEHQGVPHWEGATVSQVCFSEGTQVYIGLDQIATKVGLKTADYVAKEMYTCAQTLHNSEARQSLGVAGEPFVFSKREAAASIIRLRLASSNSQQRGQNADKLLDKNKGTSYRAKEGAKTVSIRFIGADIKLYKIDRIEFVWRAAPKRFQYYVSPDGKAWRRIYDSATNTGGILTKTGTSHAGDHLQVYTVKLDPSTARGHHILVKCFDGSTWKGGNTNVAIIGRMVTIWGTLPASTSSGKFEDDFIVPRGLNFDKMARDKHGHAVDPRAPLYVYEEETVYENLAEYRGFLEDFYKHLHRQFLAPHPYYKYHHKAAAGYEAAKKFLQVVKLAQNDDRLKEYLKTAATAVKGPILKYLGMKNPWDITDYKKLQEVFGGSYKTVQEGFAMVFGEKVSVGFVCGIKEVVVEKGPEKFPGTCCLDTPYDGNGDNWGREHSCSAECKHPGPFFGGINEHACNAQGGTWCPVPADCTELKECVDDQIQKAKDSGKLAYEKYLEPAVIKDPMNFEQCGMSRKYFGYEELYTNDEDICDNFAQLHNTKDFGFLEEFFDQGSGGGGGGGGGDAELVPLIPPSRKDSKALGKKENVYKGTLFAFQQVITIAEIIKDIVDGFKCPDDLTGAVQSGCASVSNAVIVIASAVIAALNIVHDVLYMIFDTLIGPSDAAAVESHENTAAVFDNMEIMYQRMHEAEVRQQEKLSSMEEKLTSIFEATVSEERKLSELDHTENQSLAG
ncbi:expressed unknown protein [Seminavis robusta]|uniref:F5/8 type C domain-containing protein n=1 Tax=Seminavis robusta TaxID=568900 RepID=A0A9N8EXX2_9STRA|nr:expressed unknown protein [Seminavis robusta]|eukprot:Sro2040_g312200.1 n/a (1133) ;mRNA; f:4706-9554